MKILFFGDIFGKLGREAVKETLPSWQKKFKPDFVIANAENISHGVGAKLEHLKEMEEAGIDFFTSGNHIWDRTEKEANKWLDAKTNFIRPENFVSGLPGKGYALVKIKKTPALIINFIGRLFMKEPYPDPFRKFENLIKKSLAKIVIIDFHAETTSEKRAFGWFVDGRISAFLGTHTHVPTADEQILPGGTAYITDIGMCGPLNSVIGMEKKKVIEQFYYQKKAKAEPVDKGKAEVNAVLVEVDKKSGHAKSIKRLRKIVL